MNNFIFDIQRFAQNITLTEGNDSIKNNGDNSTIDLDNQAGLLSAEGEVTVNGAALLPVLGNVISGNREDNAHAHIVGDYELIRQATAINYYNTNGYDSINNTYARDSFNIEEISGLPIYTDAAAYYLDRDQSDWTQTYAGTSLATHDFNQPMIVYLNNVDSVSADIQKTEQLFDMSSYSYTKKVYLYNGPQALKFNNDGGNLAVVSEYGSGVKNISLGAGGDAVVMDEKYALQNAVYICSGAGDDSVFVRHNANTYIDFSAGGSDILVTAGEANARVTIAGYQASTGAAIHVEEYLDDDNTKAGSIAEGIENDTINFVEGTVIITSPEGRSEVYVGTNDYGGQIVNLMTHATSGDKVAQAVGFTGENGGIVDGSTYQSPLIMIGNSENTDSAGSSLIGGYGNDTFYVGANDFISGGKGNDQIWNNGNNVLFKYSAGDGSDTIHGFNYTSTLQISDGTGIYSTTKSGSDIIVQVGDGSVLLKDAANLSTVNIEGIRKNSLLIVGTEDADEISNTVEGATIQALGGNDSIRNEGASVSIDGGDGDDYISNGIGEIIIEGSGITPIIDDCPPVRPPVFFDGDEFYIDNGNNSEGVSFAIDNDSIYSVGSNVTINGGAGNDYIDNNGSNVTISGGDGNDSIRNSGYNSIIDGEDGDDSIENYGKNNTIVGGKGDDCIDLSSYGDNLIQYNEGDGNDLIRGFSYDDTLLIGDGIGTYSTEESGSDVIVTVGDGKITLKGAASLSNPSIVGKEISGATWKLNGSTATYSNLIKVTGVKSLDGITFDGNKTVTLSEDALNEETVTITKGYTLKINKSVPTSSTKTKSSWTEGDDGFTYTAPITSAFYTLKGNTLNYTAKKGGEQFTLTGLKDTSAVTVNGKVVTIGNSSLNGKAVTISDGYTLALGDDVETSAKQTAGSFTSFSNGTAKFKSNSFSDFYTLGDNKISYTAASGGKDITITGLNKSLTFKKGAIAGITSTYSDGITTFKIKATDLTTGNVTLTGDGKLQLDSYKKPADVAATFSNGVYTQAYTPAFYSATDKKITYTAKQGGDKFTITGLKSSANPTKSNTGIKVDAKGTVTISTSALNGKAVTLVNDTKDGVNKITYKLAVDSSVRTKATTTKAAWTKKNSTFTYTAPITSDFYTLKGNTLNYTAKKGGEQFTLTGLKNTNAVTVSGKKVTIGNASLDGKAVTLTGDYTLALAKDVTTSTKKTTGAFTTVSKGTATYKTTSFSGYYKVSGKKISYTAGSGGQSITIKNLNTATKLSALKSGVTVAEQSNGSYKITFKNSAVLTTKAPTISATKGLKYTVAVADSLKPVTKSAWTVSGTNTTFRSNTTAGYTVNSKNTVVYTAQKNGSPLIELTGMVKDVKASSIAAPKNKIVTLNANVLGKNASLKSNGGGYTINLSGNMSGKKFTGTGKVDTLTVAANNANVDLGAGNDVVTVSGLKVTLNGGAGNDKLTGSKNVDLLYGGAGNDSILGNTGNDKLHGDAGNDSLRGGAGNDTLTGGKGDDQLWGDAGKDTFLFSNGDGKDIIYGFENNDLLQITGTFSASYNKSKKEIAFKVGSTANAITLKDFTATSFNVNGDTYGISGTKLVKK